jgi:hypothetical protein
MVARRLAALISLAFVMTQCAIDSRELEEQDGDDDSGGSSNGGSSNGGSSNGGSSNGGSSNGGSSNGGSSNGGTSGIPIDCQRDENDDDCFACQKAACCDEYQACFASVDCVDYVECGAPCLDSACIAACGVVYPEGETLFLDFAYCGGVSCPESC